jgi:hypothetical protein
MKSVLQILLVGLAYVVLCLAVIAGIAWWQRLPKTVPLKLDSAGHTVFRGVTINRGGERLLSRVAAHDKNAVVVIDGGTNDLRLVAGAVERVRGSGASARADVSISPTIEFIKLANFADRLKTNGVGLSVRIAPTAAPTPR